MKISVYFIVLLLTLTITALGCYPTIVKGIANDGSYITCLL